ncbi:hypothetical protein JW964_04860 [candidate division KSB1 bacterium]|nr:hypothetical protein [candidate division KSB1 bacterium]
MKLNQFSRREFIKTAGLVAPLIGFMQHSGIAQEPGVRPIQEPSVKVINPQNRVPVSLIIDDSTCLVNMAHFGIPQFAEVFPERYKQNWKVLPREIPDAFVRKFGEWCQEKGVKGKYSLVPYPACVGWLDRFLPGWSKKELEDSLALVRTLLLPNWDIHPEMISHTRIINTKTGRPYEEPSEYFMENWRWTDGKSVDELADYMRYALQILKNIGLPCEGITTPGGFGNRVLPELAQATLESCRDVFQAEIPHYFRHLFTDETSVAPRVEYASGLESSDPRCVVSIIGCTGDWFGGWEGLERGSVDKLITENGQSGRLPEVIRRNEPAIMVCHWPGIYFNGEEIGFNIFKETIQRLRTHYDNLIWMKLSEISRYWAAKELTQITIKDNKIQIKAPFASPFFTIEMNCHNVKKISLIQKSGEKPLERIENPQNLNADQWILNKNRLQICFNLPKGESELKLLN